MFYRGTKSIMGGLILLVLMVAALQNCSGLAHSAEGDVAWFSANPAARKEMIAQCRNDVRLGRRGICANAERAESLAFSRRLTPKPSDGGMYDSPIVQDAFRRACMEPAGRRFAGAHCGRL